MIIMKRHTRRLNSGIISGLEVRTGSRVVPWRSRGRGWRRCMRVVILCQLLQFLRMLMNVADRAWAKRGHRHWIWPKRDGHASSGDRRLEFRLWWDSLIRASLPHRFFNLRNGQPFSLEKLNSLSEGGSLGLIITVNLNGALMMLLRTLGSERNETALRMSSSLSGAAMVSKAR